MAAAEVDNAPTESSKSFNTFHPFPDLAPELRCKIWKETCQYPRLIELEAALNPGIPSPAISDFSVLHTFIKVSSRCRVVPGILHATRESRIEAQKVYKETNFERQPNNISTIPIYYNKDQDIIFFGENACFTTVIGIFRLPMEIPRLAVSLCYALMDSPCCRRPLILSDGGIGPGDLLLSFPDNNFKSTVWNGWGGLHEVVFVVGNALAGFQTSSIDASVALRPISGDEYAKHRKGQIEPGLDNILNYDGADFDEASRSKWLQEPKPKFSYMTRAPAIPGEIVNDYIYLHWRYTEGGRKAPETITDNHFWLRSVASGAGCTIKVSHRFLQSNHPLGLPGPLHLTLSGISPAIVVARKMLEMS